MAESRRWRMSRRGFLIGFGATAVTASATIAVGVKFGLPRARLEVARFIDESNGATGPGELPLSPDAWFEISADDTIRFFVPKIEMGQGVHTSLTQIAADELEVSWEQIEAVQADTNRPVQDSAGTGNSNSVSSMYLPIREAAATLREMMKAEAAVQLGVSVANLDVVHGIVSEEGNPQNAISYGELIQYSTNWEVPEVAPTLKPASQFRYIGQSVKRVDFQDKLMGKAVYGYDARMPGMLYGAVARPPTLEAKMDRANVGEAAEKPGVVQVVIEDDFAGVVAESRQKAYTGAYNLDVQWDEGKLWQQADIDELVTVGNGQRVVIQKEGEDVDPLLADDDPDVVSFSFRTPIAAHAHLEAQAALVNVQPDKVEAWVSTQFPQGVRDDIAEVLGRAPETVVVTPTYLGGGFGRKLNVKSAVEAARLSAAVGRPVHVGWNRTEDLKHGFFRPPTHHVVRGKLDDNGRILAMEHSLASGDTLFSIFPGAVGDLIGADFGSYRGAPIQYGIPNRQTVSYRTKLPIKTGPWRGLGLIANTFAIESFMDEMAVRANIDPLEFRLQQLPNSERGNRFRRVLEAVAIQADWGKTMPAGHAQGIALTLDANTVVAEIAEVSEENGRIRVHNITAAIDPGLVINPDGVKAQTQGGIMMGLSSTFHEEITIKDGQVEASNFDRYPLLTMDESPNIDVVLLESSETPNGVGEPPIGPVAAAVGNAYFALSGKRMT